MMMKPPVEAAYGDDLRVVVDELASLRSSRISTDPLVGEH
jgi:hypothetical protein